MAATTFMLSSIVAISGGGDSVIAEAALASDSQKLRGNQLAQVVACCRRRDSGVVSELFGRQRLTAHKDAKHRRSRSITNESRHFHQICRRGHRYSYR